MYMIVYKNGIRIRVVDKEMQKVIQSMQRCGLTYVSLIHEEGMGTVAYTSVIKAIKKKKVKA